MTSLITKTGDRLGDNLDLLLKARTYIHHKNLSSRLDFTIQNLEVILPICRKKIMGKFRMSLSFPLSLSSPYFSLISPPPLSDLYIPSLLKAVLSKLQRAESLTVAQSLILVYAQLIHSRLDAVLNFLSNVPGMY